jgi:glycosyltransferase involved in cell wall biosynthesis
MDPQVCETNRTLRIALYSHVYVHGDAISDSYGLKLELLSQLQQQGVPIEITAYCCDTDRVDAHVHRISGVADLLLQSRFWQADLHCYEFGIHSELLDSVIVAVPAAAKLAFYHNVTPARLVAPSLKGLMEKSLLQRFNLLMMHHIGCISEFNRRDLVDIGIPADRLSVVPLPAPYDSPMPCFAERHARCPVVRLLFVGRFVQSKGVRELVQAVRLLAEEGLLFEMNLVFNSQFSDKELIRRLRRETEHAGLGGFVRFLPDVTQQRLVDLYDRSDCLVVPSYHEGFGIPVLEALSTGCFVVASDAANLPFILGRLGQIVATGDVPALADALRCFIFEVHSARQERREPLLTTTGGIVLASDWWAAIALHLASFSRHAFITGFGAALCRAIAESGQVVPVWLEEARFAALSRSVRIGWNA